MSEVMIAVRSGVVRLDGSRRMIHKGRSTAHAGHPVVTGHPKLWAPLKVDYPAPDHARPEPSGLPATDTQPEPEPEPAAVRRWASERGITVSPYGKVSTGVIRQYQDAHR